MTERVFVYLAILATTSIWIVAITWPLWAIRTVLVVGALDAAIIGTVATWRYMRRRRDWPRARVL